MHELQAHATCVNSALAGIGSPLEGEACILSQLPRRRERARSLPVFERNKRKWGAPIRVGPVAQTVSVVQSFVVVESLVDRDRETASAAISGDTS